MKKEKENKPLSDYEYDSLWMSCRYCIGRHTITAHSHANDIAFYDYHRLNASQKEMMYTDINEQIYWSLKMSTFFSIENFDNVSMNPLDIFYEFINSENLKNYDELKKYKQVKAVWNSVYDKWDFEKTMLGENDKERYISSFDFEDLEIWQKLANLFNEKEHFSKTVNVNGKDEIYECYYYYSKRWRQTENDEHILFYDKVIGTTDMLNIGQDIRLNV